MKTAPLAREQQVSLVRRLSAIVYDTLLLVGVLFVASVLIVVPFEITFGHPLYPLYVLYIYAVAFLFLGWFWTHGGQTLGMKTWGIRVEQFNGDPITWRQALLRYLGALISWAALGIGFLWSLFHPQRLAWHDILSHTRLARTRTKSTSES